MLVETLGMSFRKARSTNSTDATFPSRIPTITEPTGQGVILLLGNDGVLAQNGMLVIGYGKGSDNDVFDMRVIGWRSIGESDVASVLWIPVVLAELHCTLSTQVGVAGRAVVATERFVDTMTLTTGNDDVSIDLVSPTGNVIAHAMLDLKGFQKVEVTFALTATTTEMNALLALL